MAHAFSKARGAGRRTQKNLMPKRKHGDDSPYVVETLPCLRGGGIIDVIPLPVEEVCGVSCIPLNAYAPWMNMALEGKARGEHQALVVSLVDGLINEIKDGSKPGEDNGSDPTEDTDAVVAAAAAEEALQSNTKPAKKGRAALGLESDSDEEALAEATPVGQKKQPKSAKKLPANTFHSLNFRGTELVLMRRPRGRGLLLKMDYLSAFLTHVKKEIELHRVAAAAPVMKKPRNTEPELRGDIDKGRLKWVFATHSWMVCYENAEGKTARRVKGLVVPRKGFDGNLLAAGEFANVRRQIMIQARQLWNDLDQSGDDRYAPADLMLEESAA